MSNRYLIDTNVLSELARASPDGRVVSWFQTLEEPTTSAICVYELSSGIERLAAGKRRAFLEAWLAELLTRLVTLPFDQSSAMSAARAENASRRRGRPVETRDLFVASCALRNSLIIATRNVNHFSGLGAIVYDPFTDTRTL